MPIFTHDGLDLHYEIHGEGKPVLFLHGGTVSFEFNYGLSGWAARFTALGLQVLGMDFRGHGHSAKPHDAALYGTTQFASDALALLDHLGLESVALVAYSMGTAVAMQLLHTAPHRFSRAALVATGDGLIGASPETFAKVLPPLGIIAARSVYPEDLPGHLAAYWTFIERTGADKGAMLALSQGSYPTLTPEDAREIQIPTLVVSAENDPVLGRGAELAETLPHGTYLEISGADHFSLAANPDVQNQVAAFIAK